MRVMPGKEWLDVLPVKVPGRVGSVFLSRRFPWKDGPVVLGGKVPKKMAHVIYSPTQILLSPLPTDAGMHATLFHHTICYFYVI